mgnify:CR=1 FL=1
MLGKKTNEIPYTGGVFPGYFIGKHTDLDKRKLKLDGNYND